MERIGMRYAGEIRSHGTVEGSDEPHDDALDPATEEKVMKLFRQIAEDAPLTFLEAGIDPPALIRAKELRAIRKQLVRRR